MTWTFDPLQARNANLNLRRLGATAMEFLENFYGVTSSSLHHNCPPTGSSCTGTSARRGWQALAEKREPNLPSPVPDLPRVNEVKWQAGWPVSSEPLLDLDAPEVLLEIPPDWNVLARSAPRVAEAWQARIRRAFQSYLSAAGTSAPTSRSPGRTGGGDPSTCSGRRRPDAVSCGQPLVRGFTFSTTGPFATCFSLAMGKFRPLWWLIDTPGGPFAHTHREDSASIEGRLTAASYDHPLLESMSATLWRPGTLPEFAPLLVEDEFSFLVGLHGPESAAVAAVDRLVDDRWLSESFFRSIEAEHATFLVTPRGGQWEVYSHLVVPIDGAVAEPEIVDSSKWSSVRPAPAARRRLPPRT